MKEERDEAVADGLAEGKTVRQVAEETGVAKSTVDRIAKTAGLSQTRQLGGNGTPEKEEEVGTCCIYKRPIFKGEFIEPGDRNRKTYQAFTEFCQKSLQCHPETLMDRVRDAPSLKAKIEALAIQPHGGDRKSPGIKSDNVTLDPLQSKRGNSQASGMRRLVKDRPDLDGSVVTSEGYTRCVTPNEAAGRAK